MTRFAVLDGWRGICALVVALHHLHANGSFFALPFVRGAWLFVDFFFVLSGFVIAHAYGKRLNAPRDVGPFVMRRLARLWPLHAAVLGALVGLEAAKAAAMAWTGIGAQNPPFQGETGLAALASNLLLIHALGLHDGATWNFPSWSISTEFWTYQAFALLCLARRQRDVAALLVVAGVAAAVVALRSPEWLHTIADYGLFRCVFGFFLGAAVHRLLTPRLHRPLACATGLELAAVASVAVFVALCPTPTALSMAAPVVFAAAIAVFAFAQGGVSRLLLTAPAQALGRWSYSIYMVHTLVLVALGRAVTLAEARLGQELTSPLEVNGVTRVLLELGPTWVNDLAAIVYLAAVVALSAATWRWIERPALAWSASVTTRAASDSGRPG